ncbi:O-methyltransferase [Tamlana crocina]|uniref:O-methyltransferase n=1 Tax=Tamlana crocina TaxID=393006 RepID=UPI001ADD8B82|nr:class I SAM-dependent methyltransferase [Tamlana crocina]
MYQQKQYIKFLLKSTNQHGVHSPFIYSLVTKCFYDRKKHEAYQAISSYKKALRNSPEKLSVTDLGAGSRVTKANRRSVSEMAKNAGSTKKQAKLLFKLVQYFKPNSILELGTSLGIATHATAMGNPESKIISIEGCPNISKFTKNQLKKNGVKNVSLVTGDILKEIKKLNTNSFDLVFFDANHQKEATLNYFESLLQTAHNDSVFIFDDIYWSRGMTEAWETIKQHPKVTVTIDTFFWGFVFFRTEQAKEHFTIRA